MNNWLLGKKKAIFAATLVLLISVPSIASAAQQEAYPNTMVPLRVIAESLGAQLEWEGKTSTITLVRDTSTIVIKVGEDQATINGSQVKLDDEVAIIDERAFVPKSFIPLALGSKVEWNDSTQSIDFEVGDYKGRASAFAHSLFQGDVQSVRSNMNEVLKQSLTEETLGIFSQQISAGFGQPSKRISAILDTNLVHTNVNLVYETAQSSFEIVVRFDSSGYVDDLGIMPIAPAIAFSKPEYDFNTYTEKEVVIGEGTLALPGTLTVPAGAGPFPVVVLVHGSGPHDQNSTIGGTQVFKDFSVGLASQGIAVLRYDKVSRVHTAKVSTQPEFTLMNESVDDVIKAIELLKRTEEVDASQIFIAGHSQGGYVMPLIIDNAKKEDIAGVILLSAPSEQLTDVLIEQQEQALIRVRELAFPEAFIAQQEQAVTMWTSVADLVQNPDFSTENLPTNFPIPPAYWWYEQRDYVPSELAKEQAGPMLILQGENDWQVSMNQFEGWRKALLHRSDVEFISYPNVNHLLTEYEALSIGMEYGNPANVSADIIQDIIDWIHS